MDRISIDDRARLEWAERKEKKLTTADSKGKKWDVTMAEIVRRTARRWFRDAWNRNGIGNGNESAGRVISQRPA